MSTPYGGMMPTMTDAPIALATAARQVLHDAQEQGSTPEEWQILFGEGAMEALVRAGRLRHITALTDMWGLPVTFPERPGAQPQIVSVLLYSDRGGGSVGVPVSVLIG